MGSRIIFILLFFSTFCFSQENKYPYSTKLGTDEVDILAKYQTEKILANYHVCDSLNDVFKDELIKRDIIVDSLNSKVKQSIEKYEVQSEIIKAKDEEFKDLEISARRLINEKDTKLSECEKKYGILAKKSAWEKIGNFPNWGPFKIKNILYFGSGFFLGFKFAKIL